MSQSGQGSQSSLTVAQVAARLRVTDRTIRRHIEVGQSYLTWGWLYKQRHDKSAFKTLLYGCARQDA